MAINFASARPGIDLFNANVARGDQERRAEEQDFMRRMQMEQAQGADKGMRNAIAAYYAQKQPVAVAPVPTTAFQPTPAAVPNPAATTPVVSPDQSMDPADNPDYGGPTRAAPMPNAVPRAGVDVPATVAAPPVPAAAAAPAAAQPAPGARPGGSSFAPIMSELAKQPGTGASMMQMFSHDLTSQRTAAAERSKLHMEGIRLFSDASKNGDIATMRAVSQRYDLGIPPEALNSREIMAGIATGMNTAKQIGITDDGMAVSFAKGFMSVFKPGQDPTAAIQAGIAEAQKTPPTPKPGSVYHYTDSDNVVQSVSASDNIARPVKGPKARPPQAPFNLTQGGIDTRDQELRNKAIDNARQAEGKRWNRMSSDERQRSIDAHYEFLKTGKGKIPGRANSANPLLPGGPAAPAAPVAPGTVGPATPQKRMRFDSQGNEIPG